jgi:hypothetical protein
MAEEENKRFSRHQLSENRPGCGNGWKVREKEPPPTGGGGGGGVLFQLICVSIMTKQPLP